MKALKIIGLVIIVAIIVFLVLSYTGTRKNRAQINDLSSWTEKIEKNETCVNVNSILIDANIDLISKNTNLIGTNAVAIENVNNSVVANSESIRKNGQDIRKNHVLIEENSSAIQTLSEAQKELRGVVTAHGYKVNRIVWELVFQIAYGDTPAARTKWNQYCSCANAPLWEDAVSKLTDKQTQRLLNISRMKQEAQEIKRKISNLKPKCFK